MSDVCLIQKLETILSLQFKPGLAKSKQTSGLQGSSAKPASNFHAC